jgi:hypothetical protein
VPEAARVVVTGQRRGPAATARADDRDRLELEADLIGRAQGRIVDEDLLQRVGLSRRAGAGGSRCGEVPCGALDPAVNAVVRFDGNDDVSVTAAAWDGDRDDDSEARGVVVIVGGVPPIVAGPTVDPTVDTESGAVNSAVCGVIVPFVTIAQRK